MILTGPHERTDGKRKSLQKEPPRRCRFWSFRKKFRLGYKFVSVQKGGTKLATSGALYNRALTNLLFLGNHFDRRYPTGGEFLDHILHFLRARSAHQNV